MIIRQEGPGRIYVLNHAAIAGSSVQGHPLEKVRHLCLQTLSREDEAEKEKPH